MKWNRQNPHVIASSHDRFLRIWDDRKGARPLKSIEAHATKIYGIDWNRLETGKIVTCSLDRTIKFWDYTSESNEPEHTILTPYPVWRSRHTPFGNGVLAMPQRGDNSLHLYDSSLGARSPKPRSISPVHSFVGHTEQVKEYLWRCRGTVTETVDERDFQLVSWGSDKVLRLHRVDPDVFDDVGYAVGMDVKRTTRFTRKGATYRSFRDDPSSDRTRLPRAMISDTGDTTTSMALGRFHEDDPSQRSVWHHRDTREQSRKNARRPTLKDIDPITWMRGVKIGKKSNLPIDLTDSVSTILSPSVKNEPGLEAFDSLGEEISHLGEKFPRIVFTNIDMSNRQVAISLAGPWGTDSVPTHIRIRLDFPNEYPKSAIPGLKVENGTGVAEEAVKQILNETNLIASAFLVVKQSSSESLIRYLIGEQSLEQCMQTLQKHRNSQDLAAPVDPETSSSDEDDENVGTLFEPSGDSNTITALGHPSYGVPLPRTCGFSWSGNGRLVCYFPTKSSEASLLEHGLMTSKRESKGRPNVFEGFGKLHDSWNNKRQTKTSAGEHIERGMDDDGDDYSTSSSESSLSTDPAPHHQYFLPALGWHSDGLDSYPKFSIGESQKSSGEGAMGNSTTSRSASYTSIVDLSDMLPAKHRLAKGYSLRYGDRAALQNAQVARECACNDLAKVWTFLELLLRGDVQPDELQISNGRKPILNSISQALSPLKKVDSAIDLSYDADTETVASRKTEVQWAQHPYGTQWFVNALYQHYEQEQDAQMLATMSCVLNNPQAQAPSRDRSEPSDKRQSISSSVVSYKSSKMSGYPDQLNKMQMDLQQPDEPSPMIPGTRFSSQSNTPPGTIFPLLAEERRSSQSTSLSNSPDFYRHICRSSSNFSALTASLPRPFSLTNSVASSPPNRTGRKRPSPTGSYLGITPTNPILAPTSSSFGKSSYGPDQNKASLSLATSHLNERKAQRPKRRGIIMTNLKKQDGASESHEADTRVLPISEEDEARQRAYRQAYTQLLDVWQLDVTRCELLKLFSTNEPKAEVRSFELIKSTGKHKALASDHHATLQFHQTCSSCGHDFERSAQASNNHCPQCTSVLRPPLCGLCRTYVQGLSAPCLRCRHTLHPKCRSSLTKSSSGCSILECPTGCGCICTGNEPLPILFPTSRSEVTRGEADHQSLHLRANSVVRDVSPAITVFDASDGPIYATRRLVASHHRHRSDASTTAASSPPTTLSGNPRSGGAGPVAATDLAYESLARNLKAGAATAGAGASGGSGRGAGAEGAATGLRLASGLREKGSQIWRGG